MDCSGNLSEGGESELNLYPLDEVLTKINLSVCSWTVPESAQIKEIGFFRGCSNPKRFGIYVRAFSLFIFPSKVYHPEVSTVKKLLLELSRNHSAAERILPALEALHFRLGTIPFPSSIEEFLLSIRSQIQSAIASGSLNFLAADAPQNSFLYRLGDKVLFSILVEKTAEMRVVPDYTIPLSFPVTVQEKPFILQTVAAIHKRDKQYMRSTICRATLNGGGYFLTTQVDEEKHTVKALLPRKSETPIKSKAKSGHFTYELEELFFVETVTQLNGRESFMLEEEYVFECPSLCFVKGADLRRLQNNEYMDINILEAVVELLKQRVKRLPLPDDTRKVQNIILPAHFWSTLTGVETLEELNQCLPPFQLSQYVWNSDTIVHLIIYYPHQHWQYCTFVFAEKKVFFNDSNMLSASDAESDGRNKQIKKFLRFVQELSGFSTAEWKYIDCVVPQQMEKPKHFCGTYVIVNLLRAFAEGLLETPFQQVPSWKSSTDCETENFPDCETIPIPILNALKQLIADAILGRRDIFDIFYLLLPRVSLSVGRQPRVGAVPFEFTWSAFKRNESKEKSLNLTSVRDLHFFELT